jgi:predicted permease
MRTLRRLLHLLRSSRHDADLREEMETHRTLRQDRLERDGASTRDAEDASRRALGNVTLSREDARDAWAWTALDAIGRDIRTVLRGLRKNPGFTLVAIGTLALGIGANTALFSLYNSLSLRTLPVRDPGSLVFLQHGEWTYPIWEAIDRHRDEVFDGAFAWSNEKFDLAQGGETTFVSGAYVSGRMFDVLGVAPVRGRALTPADDTLGGDAAVAVISHGFWQRHFGGRDDVVGQRLTLNLVPFTVVGVAPAGFFGPEVGRTDDVMIPIAANVLISGSDSSLRGADAHWYWWLQIMARRKPDQTLEQTNAALRRLQPRLREESLPEGSPSRLARYMTGPLELVSAATGSSELRGAFETPLVAVLAVVGLVLLIACANIANLLLARAVARQHELSVRLALGASRWRLARLLFTESLLIASIGAALGVVFASWSSALLVRQLGTWRNAVSLDLQLDWRVLGFTAALAGLTAIIAGVAPALGVRRVAPNDALKDAGRSIAGDRRFTIRGALVVTQIALSLVLVVAAGLFLRTFQSLSRVPLGFTPEPLVIATMDLHASTSDRAQQAALMQRLRAAAAAVPGVTSAATSVLTPLSGAGWNAGVSDEPGIPADRSRMTWMNAVSPDWFKTMGTRLIAGRDFADGDLHSDAHVAIVNQTFASRFLQKGSPVGQTIRVGVEDRTAYLVVGLVEDAVYRSPREGVVPTMYIPPSADDFGTNVTIATAPGQRAATQRAMATALAQTDPRVSFTFRTFDEYIHAQMLREQLVALLSTFFGALGLLLAAIGLYGVVSHAVNARRTEIGVRMALGANAGGIVRLIFRRVSMLLAIGLATGAVASLWASRFVDATMLYHLDARDPATFAGAILVLATAVVLAAWLPARRAARLDPARVLREG